MPYTNAWNTTDPSGSVAANTIDTEIQKLRLQLQERVFALLFNTPYTADPLTLLDNITGKKDSKTITFAPFSLNTVETDDDVNWSDDYFLSDDGPNHTIRINCPLPVGVTITKVEWLVDRGGSLTVSCDLMEMNFAATPAAAVSVANASTAGAGAAIVEASGLSIEVGANDYYYAKLTGSAGRFKFYGVRITYNAPDARNTY
jgi:hypothetical protein